MGKRAKGDTAHVGYVQRKGHPLKATIAHEPQARPLGRLTSIFILVSVLLFLISLSQEAYHVDTNSKPQPWACLALLFCGWLGVFEGAIAWLANPALLLTWVLLASSRRRSAAIFFGLASLALSLSFLFQRDILTDEAGHRGKITGYALGYWLWICSIVTAVGGCVIETIRGRMSPTSATDQSAAT